MKRLEIALGCFPLFRLVGTSIRHFRRDERMENEPDLAPPPLELSTPAASAEDSPSASKPAEERIAATAEASVSSLAALEPEESVITETRPNEGPAEKEARGDERTMQRTAEETEESVEPPASAGEAVAADDGETGPNSTPDAAIAAPATPPTLTESGAITRSDDTIVSIVEPIPSKTPANTASSLLASNPPSRAPTPTLTPSATTPPTPSVSPAQPKKFASSLSVNKKFLEKAGEKSKPEVKAAVGTYSSTCTTSRNADESATARLATPPVVAPVSASHPRLLTGKISSAPAISLSTAQSVPGVTGWTKNAPAAEGVALPTQSVSFNGAGRGATYERGRGIGGMGMVSRGRGNAVWGSRGSGDANMGIGGDFPTAAEVANGTRASISVRFMSLIRFPLFSESAASGCFARTDAVSRSCCSRSSCCCCRDERASSRRTRRVPRGSSRSEC